jgi:hypothetical protein
MVVEIEPAVEQLHHARFDLVGQFARDDHKRAATGHGRAISGCFGIKGMPFA